MYNICISLLNLQNKQNKMFKLHLFFFLTLAYATTSTLARADFICGEIEYIDYECESRRPVRNIDDLIGLIKSLKISHNIGFFADMSLSAQSKYMNCKLYKATEYSCFDNQIKQSVV